MALTVAGYEIEISGITGGVGAVETALASAVKGSPLTPGTTYNARIRTVFSNGRRSPWSAFISFITRDTAFVTYFGNQVTYGGEPVVYAL